MYLARLKIILGANALTYFMQRRKRLMELTTDANDTVFVAPTIYFVRPKMVFSLFLPTNVVLG